MGVCMFNITFTFIDDVVDHMRRGRLIDREREREEENKIELYNTVVSRVYLYLKSLMHDHVCHLYYFKSKSVEI